MYPKNLMGLLLGAGVGILLLIGAIILHLDWWYIALGILATTAFGFAAARSSRQ